MRQQADEVVGEDDDVALADEGRQDAGEVEGPVPAPPDEEERQGDQEEAGRVGHPVLVLVPADGALGQAEEKQPGYSVGGLEAEVPEVEPGGEQEAEEEDVGEGPEGDVDVHAGLHEAAGHGRHRHPPDVGVLPGEGLRAPRVPSHRDVAPVVGLLHVARLVDEAQLGGHGDDVDGQDEDGEEGSQAHVSEAEAVHPGMIIEAPVRRKRPASAPGLYRGRCCA